MKYNEIKTPEDLSTPEKSIKELEREELLKIGNK